MTNPSISLQDLRRKLYLKAKAEKGWRFWGIFVHVCKEETLHEAYLLAKANKGAPGIDGVTFEAIERDGLSTFISELRQFLICGSYPKPDGSFRRLKIPAIRDRVVQGALKLILEPIFDADFHPGSFGYRPKRTAHQAIHEVAKALASRKTKVIDVDLKAYFDTVRHDKLLSTVGKRVGDPKIMRLLKLILKSGGKQGVPQGGVISPLLSNLYLNEVDAMLEKAKHVTRRGRYTHIEYARFADDLIILVDYHPKWNWLLRAAVHRLRQELLKLGVSLNESKSQIVNLECKGVSFDFLGFTFRLKNWRIPKLGPLFMPKARARKSLLSKIKKIFRSLRSQPLEWIINSINPILRGWVNYFRIGNSAKCFSFVKWWVERKARRHLMRARLRKGFGWKRWNTEWFYQQSGLFNDYAVRYATS